MRRTASEVRIGTPVVMMVKGNYGLTGGPETILATMARHLDRTKVRPVLALVHRSGVAESPQLSAGQLAIERCDVTWSGLVASPLAALRMAKVVAYYGADLIHTHDMRADLLAYLLTRRRKVPWIAHVHGWLGHTQTGRWKLYERMDQWLVRYADLVLVGSTVTRDEVLRAGARRVEVLPNAIQIEPDRSWEAAAAKVRAEINAGPEAVVVGMSGRIHPGKGQQFLIQAIAKLAGEGRPIRGLVVGEGPNLEHLRTLATQLGAGGLVTFAGFRPELTPYVAAMDVFVAPSLKESLPLAVLEAMSLRRATVASRVGDLPHVIEDGKNGLLIPPGDVEALCAAIRQLAADQAVRARMGAEARATIVARYSAEAMSRRLEEIYLSEIGRRHSDS